tara:strand:+ start:759 stop:2294 length:1536 start_codon:yes stop_codon:yes gene_type:complete
MGFDINVGDFLTTRAYLNPEKEALYDVQADQRFSYDEINRRANKSCAALQSLGLKKGDRVALLAYNGHEFLESFFGLAKAGLVLMPLNWRLTAQELSFILQDGGARAIIFDAEFESVIEQIWAQGEEGSAIEHWIRIGEGKADFTLAYEDILAEQDDAEPTDKAGADDNLFIMYTSGTTGLPKGVVHTHNTLLWAVLTFANTADGHFSDRYLVMLPLFHVGALTPTIIGVYTGNSLVVPRNFDPERAWSLVQQERVTSSLAVPAMLRAMLQVSGFEQYDWSSLRWIMSGAAPLPVVTIHAYQELGIEIHQIYGLTEVGGPACLIGPDDAMRKIGSTGKAPFHTKVRVIGSDGAELPPGEAGELIVTGGHIMKEYWRRPEATAQAIQDGWLLTGDLAVQDAEGFVTIQDRIKDMIISGGENVYPAEIENVLLQHPRVADVAVIGQASEKWGESPAAIVVRKVEALTADELLDHCSARLARYKLPKAVIFVAEIPRNPSGKILKRILREQHPG